MGQTSGAASVRELRDTIQDVCGRLDLEAALQAIVERADRLLQGDLSYLAICDDRREVLTMRAFVNVRSPRFRALAMPYGVGLGGAVAAHRSTRTVERYEQDEAIVHDRSVDEATADEGIVASVGAPVEFEGRLLAILFVGSRTARKFTSEDTETLSGLAAAAAIAINNALVHGRLLAAMTVHRKLLDPALTDQGPSAVARVLAGLVEGPVRLEDWRGRVLAAADHEGRTLDVVPSDGRELRRVAVHDAWEVGATLLVDPGATDQELVDIAVEQALTVFALELSRLRSSEQVTLKLRGGLVAELIDGSDSDEPRLLRQADALGCDLSRPHSVVAVVGPQGQNVAPHQWHRTAQVLGSSCITPDTGGLVAERGESLVMILPTSAGRGVRAAVQAGVLAVGRAGLGPLYAGISSDAHSFADYPARHREARRALEAGRALHRLGHVVHHDDLGFSHVLMAGRPTAELQVLARASLAPVLEHDSRRDSALVPTLMALFEGLGNIEGTSRRLGVHANTVRGRLQRCSSLLERDLEDPVVRLDLYLALRVLYLTGVPAAVHE